MVKSKPRIVIENIAKILASIKELAARPEKHPTDKYCLKKDGSYRAFEIYKYRISFHVSQEQITVIMIRHTKMEPKSY